MSGNSPGREVGRRALHAEGIEQLCPALEAWERMVGGSAEQMWWGMAEGGWSHTGKCLMSLAGEL